jgi:hypothetical protein
MQQLPLVCVVLVLLVSTGCGDKTKDGGDTGAQFGTKPSEWIVGRWDVKPADAPAELKMQWEFKTGGEVAMSLTMGAQSKDETATWKKVSEDQMSFVMELNVQGERKAKKVTVSFEDVKSARLEAEGESEVLYLTRIE